MPETIRIPRRISPRRLLALFLLIAAAGSPVVLERLSAQTQNLQAVSPLVDSITGFPLWYQDASGLRLEACLDDSGNCLAVMPTVLPNPNLPMRFPDNLPDEHFYWSAAADLTYTGGTAFVEFALENAWVRDIPEGAEPIRVQGEQMTFMRIRVRADGLVQGRTYTLTHPYGVDTFVAEAGKDTGEINMTEDTGCFPSPPTVTCDFRLAWAVPATRQIGIGHNFLVWDTFGKSPAEGGPPRGYVGDPNVPHRVVGSPTGNNFVRLTGAGLDARSDLFAVEGKLAGVNVKATPKGGAFNIAQNVTLQASDPEASIFYTLDGSDPSDANNGQRIPYSGVLNLSADTTLKFYAEATDPTGRKATSVVVAEQYTFDYLPPSISVQTLPPASGVVGATWYYNDTVFAELRSDDPTATIYYTLNGTNPTATTNANRIKYTGPIVVNVTTTLKAAAIDPVANWSPIETVALTIDKTVPPVPSGLTMLRASDSGAADGITNIATPEFTGTAEPRSTISLILDDDVVVGTAVTGATTGTFRVKPAAAVADGTHTFRVLSTDLAGNASAASTVAVVTSCTSTPCPIVIDTLPPDVKITQGPASPVTGGTDLTFSFSRGTEPIATALGWTCTLTREGDQEAAPAACGTQVGTTAVYTHTYPMRRNGRYTFKAMAQDRARNTGVATHIVEIDAPAPTLTSSHESGTFREAQTVTLTSSEGASIYATTDGSTPAPLAGQAYNGTGIVADKTTTIKAIAADALGNTSAVKTVVITIDNTAPSVTANPPAGLYNRDLLVKLSSDEPNTRIRYTTDGTAPAADSALYTDAGIPIAGPDAVTLQFVAEDQIGNVTEVVAMTYEFDTQAPAVSATPAGSTFRSATVTLQATEPDSAIYFTLDGSTPTTGSAKYADPLNITTTTTLKAIAVDRAGNASDPLTEVYAIDLDAPVLTVAPAGRSFNAPLTVTLASNDPEARLFYGLGGAEPTTELTGNTVTVSETSTLTFKAVDALGNESAVVTETYTLDTQAPQPSASPDGGAFNAPQTVALNSGDEAARVYYTTDGSTPDATSPHFTGSGTVSVDQNLTLAFYAVDAAGNLSQVISRDFTIDTVLPSVSAEPAGGLFNAPQSVTLTSSKSGQIHYTLNGDVPTKASPVAAGPIAVAESTTIKFFAVDAVGNVSPVKTEAYEIDTVDPAVSASPAGGTYNSARSVALSSEPDARIFFTLDGTVPTAGSTEYSQPIAIDADATLRFVAVDKAGNVSGVVAEDYAFDRVAPSVSAQPAGGLFNQAQAVTLTSTKAGTIRYTTDGSEPSATSGTVYTAAVAISASATLKFVAVDSVGNVSNVTTETYEIDTVAPAVPTASVKTGTFSTAQTVSLSAEPGAVIHFTTNGDAPTASSEVYSAAIPIAATTTLRFIAIDAATNASAVGSETYTIDSVKPVVTLAPAGGTFNAAQTVTITSTKSATIHYTLDGSSPTAASATYSAALPLPSNATTTVKAMSVDAVGNTSDVVSATYVIDTVAPTVTASPAGGTFSGPQAVTLSSSEPGTIRYTTDGSAPTAGSPVYAAPIQVGSSLTLRFFATDAAGNQSAAGSASFTINTAPVDSEGPAVVAPVESLPLNSTLATTAVPVTIRWSATDPSGVTRYELQSSANGGASYANVTLPSATATSYSTSFGPGSTVRRYRVRATDALGNVSAWVQGAPFTISAAQENAPAVTYTGTWATAALTNAYGGSTASTSAAGARAIFTFTGTHVSWVAPKSNNRGRAEVWIDGQHMATVDLYDSSTLFRRAVFTQALPAGTHTLEVRVLGTRNPASTGNRIDVDAFIVFNGTSVGTAPAVVTPTANPAGGTFTGPQTVTLTAPAGSIRYTTDGTTPTATSTLYTAPISISDSTELRFIAIDGANVSAVGTATYTISPADTTAPIVSASPGGGTFTSAQTVTLAANEAATIYYTTDNTAPSTASAVYTGPITIAATTTLRFIGVDTAGNQSGAGSAVYTINTPDTTAPVVTVSPAGGTFATAQTVTLAANEPATIYYTTNNTAPSTASPVYSGPITIAATTTLRYIARDTAGNQSAAGSAVYTINAGPGPDTTAPTATAPVHTIALDSTLATTTVPVVFSWSGADNAGGSGLARYELQRSANAGGSYSAVTLATPTATSVTISHSPNSTQWKYRVRAIDVAGNVGAWVEGPVLVVGATQENGAGLTYAGTWTTAALTNAYGGSTASAAAAGARATLTFTGSYVAWVAPKGNNRGRAEVWIDGVNMGTVDLYSSSTLFRRVVFSRALAAGTHTLEVRVLGTRTAPSTANRIDVDAFVVIR